MKIWSYGDGRWVKNEKAFGSGAANCTRKEENNLCIQYTVIICSASEGQHSH